MPGRWHLHDRRVAREPDTATAVMQVGPSQRQCVLPRAATASIRSIPIRRRAPVTSGSSTHRCDVKRRPQSASATSTISSRPRPITGSKPHHVGRSPSRSRRMMLVSSARPILRCVPVTPVRVTSSRSAAGDDACADCCAPDASIGVSVRRGGRREAGRRVTSGHVLVTKLL